MKFFFKGKDGGPDSNTTGYWLVEIKSLFSIVLLKFEGKSRPVYHNHAFNCINWVLEGGILEYRKDGPVISRWASFKPFMIYRDTMHKVDGYNRSWVLSIRGPWSKTWKEITADAEERVITLSNGRVQVYD